MSTPQGYDLVAVSSAWIRSFEQALQSNITSELGKLWLTDSWFRDLLAFTWDLRCQHRRDNIVTYLTEHIAGRRPIGFELDDRVGLAPSKVPLGPSTGIQAAFKFETSIGACRGLVTLARDDNEDWKAYIVMVMLDELTGRPERGPELGLYDDHRLTWQEVSSQRRDKFEENPCALIIGAGQTGLQVAARFNQMGISYIVLEKNEKIGDTWRQRYPTLTLHTPRVHHQFLYAPFPSTWPTFAPKDKLADWMEHYALSQDLLVWTDSELLPTPEYDSTAKRWSARVRRGSKEVVLRPAHIVVATGVLGDLVIPDLPGSQDFDGEIMHASHFPGGQHFSDQRLIVIGAGNTAADICQDAVNRGVRECWMVQRSSTAVTSMKYLSKQFAIAWPEGVPIDILDFKSLGTPFFRLREVLQTSGQPAARDFDKDMLDGLRKAGFHLNDGPEGAGTLWAVFRTLGGFFLDVGCAELIADGHVKIKHGVQPVRFEKNKVVFSDGSELSADAVIFATGYHSMRDSIRRVFGDEVMHLIPRIWNMDSEGELCGIFRPTGQRGLWFAAGGFPTSRAMSKHLGIQILAEELGIKDSYGDGNFTRAEDLS